MKRMIMTLVAAWMMITSMNAMDDDYIYECSETDKYSGRSPFYHR